MIARRNVHILGACRAISFNPPGRTIGLLRPLYKQQLSTTTTAQQQKGFVWDLHTSSRNSVTTASRVSLACSSQIGVGGGSRLFSAQSTPPSSKQSSTSNNNNNNNNSNNNSQNTNTESDKNDRNKVVALYALATVIAVTGLSYAAVPLYKAFCQATGYGGTTQRATEEAFKKVTPVPGGRPITIMFNADTGASMPWVFKPQQRAVKVVPGETALAFYTAYNPTDKPITGVSTYNITPMRAGLYFNKIQCFCFEEQRLRPHEEIDMPVFFYVDPAFLQDPAMDGVKSLTLSYTFFRTGDQEVLGIGDEIRRTQGRVGDVTNEGGVTTSTGGIYKDKVVGNSSSSGGGGGGGAGEDSASERARKWTAEVAARVGLQDKLRASSAGTEAQQ